jgi:hypothetical protein
MRSSPAGTAENVAAVFQSSLRDLVFFFTNPGIEMPGYFQSFLRNKAPSLNESLLWHINRRR